MRLHQIELFIRKLEPNELRQIEQHFRRLVDKITFAEFFIDDESKLQVEWKGNVLWWNECVWHDNLIPEKYIFFYSNDSIEELETIENVPIQEIAIRHRRFQDGNVNYISTGWVKIQKLLETTQSILWKNSVKNRMQKNVKIIVPSA